MGQAHKEATTVRFACASYKINGTADRRISRVDAGLRFRQTLLDKDQRASLSIIVVAQATDPSYEARTDEFWKVTETHLRQKITAGVSHVASSQL